MGTAQVVITALSLSCLIVVIAILAVLRSGRRESKPAPTPTGDTSVSELAQRIRAAQPSPARRNARRPASTNLGRMPELPGQSEPPAAGFGSSGAWETSQPARSPAVPRLGSGPLVPIQSKTPSSPLPRYGSDTRGASAYPGFSAGAPSWPSPAASTPSGGLVASNGRIPGFAVEDRIAAVLRQVPMPPTPANEQQLRAAAQIYDDGIRLALDPQLDVVDLIFAACPLSSEPELVLAFSMLNERFEALLRPAGRDRAALLVDVAGLEIRAEITEAWVQALRQFLLARCAQAGAGQFLLARYNSRIRSGQDRRLTLQRIQTATVTAALNSQTQIFGSREEAAALIRRLRELALAAG